MDTKQPLDLKLLSVNGKIFINPTLISHIVKSDTGVEIYVSGHETPVATLSANSFDALVEKLGGYSGF